MTGSCVPDGQHDAKVRLSRGRKSLPAASIMLTRRLRTTRLGQNRWGGPATVRAQVADLEAKLDKERR
jgi:hypothetical protein